MLFTPKPVPKRVIGGVVCLMLVMLGVASFALVGPLGTADSSGPEKIRATVVTGTAWASLRADAFVTAGQAAIRALTAVITKVVTEWWPMALLLDWMQTVHRAWPTIHRLPGTSPPQP